MFSQLLYQYRWIALLIIGATTLLSVNQLSRLEVSLDFANFLPETDSTRQFFDQHCEALGQRRGFLMLALPHRRSVYDSVYLARVAAFTQHSRRLQWVEETTSLPLLEEARHTFFGTITSPVLNYRNPQRYSHDSMRIRHNPLVHQRYISTDQHITLVYLRLNDQRKPKDNQRLIFQLDTLLTQYGFIDYHMVGIPNYEARFSALASAELNKFLVICILLIIGMLWGIYRHLTGVLLPLLVFLLTLINTGGLLAMMGRTLDMESIMLPSILLIVSLSDAIHILSRFQTTVPSTRPEALFPALNIVALNNFLTSFTTALGFLTLTMAPMISIQNFGIDAALGVMIAFVISILFIPAVLFSRKKLPDFKPLIFSMGTWYRFVDKLEEWLQLHSQKVFFILLFLMLIAGALLFSIPHNPTLASGMPPDHPVQRDLLFFDTHLGGGRDYELAVVAKHKKLNDWVTLKGLEKLHQYLDSLGISGLISPVSYYKALSKYKHGGNPAFFKRPDSEASFQKLEKSRPAFFDAAFNIILDSARTRGAFIGRIKDSGKNEAAHLNQMIDTWINSHIDTSAIHLQPTGIPLLMDRVNDLLVRTMLKGLALAILFIGFLMALLFRKARLVLITLIVNLIPVLLVGGLMGLFGVELRGSISMAFTLAFVIAIDDSIHFLNNFNHALRSGQSVATALTSTLKHTGLAIFLTSLVLFVAFILLLSSAFNDVQVIGLLISATVVFALLTDLILAPLLIKYFWKW